MLAVRYLRDVSAVLHLRSLASGTLLQAVRLPGLGSVELSGRRESPVMFFSYNSLTDPGATYTCAPTCTLLAYCTPIAFSFLQLAHRPRRHLHVRQSVLVTTVHVCMLCYPCLIS